MELHEMFDPAVKEAPPVADKGPTHSVPFPFTGFTEPELVYAVKGEKEKMEAEIARLSQECERLRAENKAHSQVVESMPFHVQAAHDALKQCAIACEETGSRLIASTIRNARFTLECEANRLRAAKPGAGGITREQIVQAVRDAEHLWCDPKSPYDSRVTLIADAVLALIAAPSAPERTGEATL